MVTREAVRALLLNPQQELLLIKIVEPVSKRAFWLTPGGGIDPGEAPVTGLRREVFEETGLREFEVGPEVWRREHRFTWAGQRIVQRERFYLIRSNGLNRRAGTCPIRSNRTPLRSSAGGQSGILSHRPKPLRPDG